MNLYAVMSIYKRNVCVEKSFYHIRVSVYVKPKADILLYICIYLY